MEGGAAPAQQKAKGPLEFLFAAGEQESRPGLVNGTDLVINDAGAEPGSADNILCEVGGEGGTFLRPDNPDAAIGSPGRHSCDIPSEFNLLPDKPKDEPSLSIFPFAPFSCDGEVS